MEKYFIFLDIDGTLWDCNGKDLKYLKSEELNRDSVEAVNYLASNLKNNGFSPEVVVISKQRVHWQRCKNLLRFYGLNPDLPLVKLPIGKFTRGERISLLLHDDSKGKNIYKEHRNFTVFDYLHTDYAKKCNNYVVIDDRPDALQNIPTSNYIQTNIRNGRLKHEMVTNWLESKNMEITPPTKQSLQEPTKK